MTQPVENNISNTMKKVTKKISSHTPVETNLQNNLQDIDTLPVGVDRINSISQKEKALYESKVTRRKVYERIGELLDATKTVKGYDSDGNAVETIEPDLQRRKEGAELAMRAFGDSKEFLSVNTQVNNVMDVKSIIEAINSGKQ